MMGLANLYQPYYKPARDKGYYTGMDSQIMVIDESSYFDAAMPQ
jgi:hypothetical protein